MKKEINFLLKAEKRSTMAGILVLVFGLLVINPERMIAAQGNMAEFTAASNSYISAASTAELKTFSALTMEAWIKPVSGGGEWALIMGKQYNPADSNPWYSYRFLAASANSSEKGFPRRVSFNIAPVTTGGEVGVASTTVVPVDVWTHVAGVYDGATMKIYINGVLENTVSQTGDLKASDLPLYIGKAPWTNYNNYNGQMDELRVWNVARTEYEIQENMHRSLTGTETGLVAYWQFNDAAGSPTTVDSSPYSHTGTLNNGAAIVAHSTVPFSCVAPPTGMTHWWGGDNNTLDIVGTSDGTLQNGATFADGLVNEAFSFDGADDYVEISDSTGLTPGTTFTVDGWFFLDPNAPENNGDIAPLVDKSSSGSPEGGWYLIFDDRSADGFSKSIRFVVMSGVIGNYSEAYANNLVPSAGWYHVAAAYDQDATPQSKLYINGMLAAQSSTSFSYLHNTIPVRIGAMHDQEYYPHGGVWRMKGLADEVQLFDRALSADEVAAIYDAGIAGNCRPCRAQPSGTVSWWRGENNGADSVGTNDGTLEGVMTFAPGMVGEAFSFEGTVSRVVLPVSSSWDFGTGSFSLSAWFKTDMSGTYGNIIRYHSGCGTGEFWGLRTMPGGEVQFIITANSVQSTNTYNDNFWHHVTAVRDGTAGQLHLYVDGIEVATPVSDGGRNLVAPAGTLPAIGAMGMCGAEYFRGLIDEVQVLNTALSADRGCRHVQCRLNRYLRRFLRRSPFGDGLLVGRGRKCC